MVVKTSNDKLVTCYARICNTYPNSVHFQRDEEDYFIDVIIDRETWTYLGSPHGIRVVVTEEGSE